MALLPLTHSFIEVPVSDWQMGDTLIKQLARFSRLEISQNDEGELNVLVFLKVLLFSADKTDATGFGPRLTGQGVQDYAVTLTADNNCAVYYNPLDSADPRNGEILLVKSRQQSRTHWLALAGALTEPAMLQGDFFEVLLHNAPVEISPMLVRFIEQADTAPFSKFAH